MQAPPTHALADPDRLAAVREMIQVDASSDESFDRLTDLAARIVHVPVVLVAVVDDRRERVLSAAGPRGPEFERQEISLSDSFCRHVVASGRPMVLQDARRSARVRDSTLIQGMQVMAYAGFPLLDDAANVLGAFCAVDVEPRAWSDEELRVLSEFALLAGDEVGLRRALRRMNEADAARREAEAALAAAIPFRSLVEESQVGIYVLQGGRFRYVNQTFARIVGYPTDELCAMRPVLGLVDEADRERVVRQLGRELKDAGGSVQLHFRGRRGDGSAVEVEAMGAWINYGGRPALVGTIVDVTERDRAESELRASEERYRRLFEEDLTGSYVATPEGRIVDCNPAFARIFGFGSVHEAVGATLPEPFPPPADPDAAEGSLREIDLQRPDGTPVRAIETHVDVRDSAGKLVEVRGYVFDITERARAEEAVQRSERRFRGIFDGTSQVCALLSLTGTILEVNRSLLELAGAAPEDVVGLSCWDAPWWGNSPEARDRVREALGRAARGETVRQEEALRGAGARCPDVELCIRPMPGEHGEPELLILEGWDITARKEAQAQLQESEERLRLVERATNDVIWDWDMVSGRVLWNDAGPRRFRYAPEELVPSVAWHTERIHPEDRERIVGGIHAVISGVDDFWSDEYRFLRGDGSYATVLDRAYVVRNERGEPIRMIGSILDTTERRRTEEAQRFLARASALLDTSLEIEPTLSSMARLCVPELADYCLIDLVDEQGGLRRVAVAHADPTKEGLLCKDERHPPTDDPLRHPALRVVRTRESVLMPEFTSTTLREIGHDAAHRERLRKLGLCSYLIVPMIVHDEVQGALTLAFSDSKRRHRPVDLVLAEDLAQRAALAIEHARLYARAQRAVGAREEVLGVVTHDLRNPLNTILMTTMLLRDMTPDRRSGTIEWLDIIRRAAGQMSRLIDDLMDISSIDAGRFSVDPHRHDVGALVRGAQEMLAPLAEARRIQIRADVPADLPHVWVDADQILRVLSNLIGNAVKFTPEGGRITVKAGLLEQEVCFSVADTGPGIPPEHLEHVFDRYWQARRGDRRGAGLGLTIASGIVAAHGGRIWAESRVGRGAVFTFTVPRYRRVGAPPAAKSNPAA